MRPKTVLLVLLTLVVGIFIGLLWSSVDVDRKEEQTTRDLLETTQRLKAELARMENALNQVKQEVKEFSTQTPPPGERIELGGPEQRRKDDAKPGQAESDWLAEYRKNAELRERREAERLKAEKLRVRTETDHARVLIVDAEYTGGFACYDRVMLRKLLAWRKGNLYEYTFAQTWLKVKKVIGDPPPDLPKSAADGSYAQVYLLNDAALALRTCQKARGQWKLTALPNGDYAVMDGIDTPFAVDWEEVRKPLVDASEDLTSSDPKRQMDALLKIPKENSCSFSMIPLLIRLLDRTEVANGEAIRSVATSALAQISCRLFGQHDQQPKTKAEWEKWWADLLAADPFPAVPLDPGELRLISEHHTDQMPALLYQDPRGRFAVMAAVRLNQPLHGARSGLRFLDLEAQRPAQDDFIYKVSESDRNRELQNLAGASAENSVALVWTEYEHDRALNTVKFMSVDLSSRRGTPVDLGLKRVRRLALCPMPDGHWLLAYTYLPAEADFLNPREFCYGLLLLNNSGQVQERPPPFQHETVPTRHMDGVIAAMVSYPGGLAVVHANDSGRRLLLLDDKLNLKKQIPFAQDFGFLRGKVGMAVAGETICLTWLVNDRILMQRFNLLTGKSLAQPASIATEHTYWFAGPVSQGDEFAIIWHDSSQTCNQIRLITVGGTSQQISTPRILYDGRSYVSELTLGTDGHLLKALFFDSYSFPKRVWLKLVDPKQP